MSIVHPVLMGVHLSNATWCLAFANKHDDPILAFAAALSAFLVWVNWNRYREEVQQ